MYDPDLNNEPWYQFWWDVLSSVFLFPFWIANYYLTKYVWVYRWMRGGHWEKWDWAAFAEYRGTEWVKVDTCTHIKGTKPDGNGDDSIYKRRAYKCEEGGKNVSPQCAIWCPGCDCNLFQNPDAHHDDNGKRPTIIYSCDCGEWSRWLSAIGLLYVGDPRKDK
jgi:hypothetical protein